MIAHFYIVFTLEMKMFLDESGIFQKVMSHKFRHIPNFIPNFVTFENGHLHVMWNIWSIALLSRVNDKTKAVFMCTFCTWVQILHMNTALVCLF